ncbi:MAG: VOC family protein [Candidatus Saccharibacteria bacterium]
MIMSDNPVVHFEMPYEDAERVVKFYEDAFGWDMVNAGKEMGDYVTAATAETDADRMVKTPGTINGGFYPLSSAPESKEPSVVVSVKDVRKAMDDITKAGGKLLGEPVDIPGVGLYVSFRDTEGNRASILQAKRS